MKQLSDELHWPGMTKEVVDDLYLYTICVDDRLEIPAKEDSVLCYSAASLFPDPSMCDLKDVFFDPKFRESGHSLQFMFGQLHCIHNGEYEVPVSALRFKYDGSENGTEWLPEEDTVTFQKFLALALGSRVMTLSPDGQNCSIIPRMVMPRTYSGPKAD